MLKSGIVMKHHPSLSRLRPCSLRRALSLSVSLGALGLTSACDTIQYSYESLTSARPAQTVEGARRAPELNSQLPVSGQGAPLPPVPMSAPVVASQSTGAPSPFDTYDGEGKPVAAIENVKAAPAPQPQGAENAPQPSLLGRWFGSDTTVAPAPVAADDNIRKPLPGNSYVSTDTSQTAPLGSAPQTSDVGSAELTYPKLSSVPAASPRFNEIRNEKEQNLAELNTQQRNATEARNNLDRDVQAELADGVVLSNKTKNLAQPLVAPAPEVKALPEPSPLPPVNVSSKPAFLSEPLTPAPLPIAAAPIEAAPASAPAAGNGQQFLDNTAPTAPSKILRASRYEQRRTSQSGN
jgi:hypothetical protein